MALESFESLYARAVEHHGDALEAQLPKPKSSRALARIRDDRWLSEASKCIFRSGFVWKVVEAKWPAFEEVFAGFDVTHCAMLSDEDLEHLGGDARVIRNGAKLRAVQHNAQFIREIREEHGSFAKFVCNWPAMDRVGLLEILKKRGARLGGNTGAMFLRFMGVDMFLFSPDVIETLAENGVIDKPPTSAKALRKVQAAFDEWHAQSGRSYTELSRIAACARGPRR